MVSIAAAIGVVGAIIIIGTLITRLAEKTKIPNILPLLVLGIILGPASGLFDPMQFADLIRAVIMFALIVVLFDAGYGIRLKYLKQELLPSTLLAFFAVLATVAIAVPLSIIFFHFSWQNGLLLGALIASTDITIILPLLKSINISTHTRNILELESTINSPIAIIIATTAIGLLYGAKGAALVAVPTFLYQLFIGIAIGVIFGFLLLRILKRLGVEERPEILSIGAILLVYAIAQLIGASGIFAVFVSGIILGNAKPPLKRIITSFRGNIELLLVIFVFVILGAMLKLNILLSAGLLGLLFALIIFFSRAPVIYAYRRKWADDEKYLFLMGPKGIVCAVLALSFMHEFPSPNLVLGLVFILILTTIIAASLSQVLVGRIKIENFFKKPEEGKIGLESTKTG